MDVQLLSEVNGIITNGIAAVITAIIFFIGRKVVEFLDNCTFLKELNINVPVSEAAKKDLEECVLHAVLATSQTYVDKKKADGLFDKDAAEEALYMAVNYVIDSISTSTKDYFNTEFNNDEFISKIKMMIESTIKTMKVTQ